MGMFTSALTHLMFTTLQWYGHSHVHTTVGMARCVQAAVVVAIVQFAERCRGLVNLSCSLGALEQPRILTSGCFVELQSTSNGVRDQSCLHAR